MEIKTFCGAYLHPLFELFVLNAQSAKVYFSELAINTCELENSWQLWKLKIDLQIILIYITLLCKLSRYVKQENYCILNG